MINNNSIPPEIIPTETPINAIDIASFKDWLLALASKSSKYFSLILGRNESYGRGIVSVLGSPIHETDLHQIYCVDEPKFDEKISIIREKTTGNLFYFAIDIQAQPQIVLMGILMKFYYENDDMLSEIIEYQSSFGGKITLSSIK